MTETTLSRSIFIAGLLAGLITASLFISGTFEPLETSLYDKRLKQAPARPLDRRVVVMDLGRDDVPHRVNEGGAESPSVGGLMGVVETLSSKGARVIAFDFPIEGTAESVDALSEVASKHGSVVFSGNLLEADPGVAGPHLSIPPKLSAVAIAVGYRNRLTDADGVLRRFTPAVGPEVEIAVAVASAARSGSVSLPRAAPNLDEQRRIGTGPQLLVPFAADDPVSFTYSDVSDGRADVKGKTVIIGSRSFDVGSKWQTPVGSLTESEVTAQIASGLLAGKGIARAPIWLVVVALIGVSGVMTFRAARPQMAYDFLLPVAVGAGIWVLGGIALRRGTWIDTVPLFALLIGQMILIPLMRILLPALFARKKAPPTLEASVFHDCMLQTLLSACFAETGCIWVGPAGERQVVASIGGVVPEHLVTGHLPEGVVETNRDEGQIIWIPIGDGHDVGAVLIRKRSMTLANRRLMLVKRVASIFAGEIESSKKDTAAAVERCLSRIAVIADEEDHFSADHPAVLTDIALEIARKAAIPASDLDALRLGCLLHDIGKIGVPDVVLDNADRLSDAEYELVKRHALVGQQIIAAGGLDDEVAEAVMAHHERWDGRGYPHGSKGEEIPVSARVLAIADAIASMISDRPYRKGMSFESAVEEVANQRARMFDPWLVEATVELAIARPDLFKGGPQAGLREPA